VLRLLISLSSFSFHHPSRSDIFTLSRHDALPILRTGNALSRVRKSRELRSNGLVFEQFVHGNERADGHAFRVRMNAIQAFHILRSEEHTSELQSPYDLVCRRLLEKKKKRTTSNI